VTHPTHTTLGEQYSYSELIEKLGKLVEEKLNLAMVFKNWWLTKFSKGINFSKQKVAQAR